MIDTHAHINLHAFKDDAGEVLQKCFDAGIMVINVGTEIKTSTKAVELLAQYPRGVYAAVGLHPSHAWGDPYLDENESALAVGREEFDYEEYKKLAVRPRVVGIGECGLDYYRLQPADLRLQIEEIKKQQRDAFLLQMKLAQELDKVLVIHCRPSAGSSDAYEDLLGILSSGFLALSTTSGIIDNDTGIDSRLRGNDGEELRFEIHSYTGDWDMAQNFLDIGGYLGFNGILTFDKIGVLAEVVRNTPLDRILLETDSPYLAPASHRGKRNEPVNVIEVAKKIAEIKNISLEEVSTQTTKNAQFLFHFLDV